MANPLQSGQKIKKWEQRARVGINLGFSPRHARTVSLVLSLDTGLVSPQFHIAHDDFFETVRQDQDTKVESKWQTLAGLNKVGTNGNLEVRRATNTINSSKMPPTATKKLEPELPDEKPVEDSLGIGSEPEKEAPLRRSDRIKNKPQINYS